MKLGTIAYIFIFPCFIHAAIPPADYIVVGVGTAGALIAEKLTEDKTTSVIALHNGSNLTENPLIQFSRTAPIAVSSALFDSPFYQVGETIPQIKANNRSLMWVLSVPEGGASSINAGAWCRGTNDVYAQWEKIAGPNWSVNNITNTYVDLETYSGQTTNPSVRGTNGPLTIRQPQVVTNVGIKLTQAIAQATAPKVPSFIIDFNDPNTPVGPSSQLQYAQSLPDGTFRVSSATAFLNENVMTPDGIGVNGRKLNVFFNATARRIIWQGNTAVGVEYMQDGVIKQVMAKKEVIVCAGLFSSAFLMYSGVGPGALLQSLNIPVKFDNPNVGQGLADQNRFNLLFSLNPDDSPFPPVDPNNFLNQIAWLPDPLGDQSKRLFHLATLNISADIALGLLVLSQPLSRGSITINSADPSAPPVIDLGVLTDTTDFMHIANFFMITLKKIHNALQFIDPSYGLISPDPSILNSFADTMAFIKENISSNVCFQSHCRMAPLTQGGVVDSNGRVYGVRMVRVVDTAIVPAAVDGTPMAAAYLIATIIANLILSGQ